MGCWLGDASLAGLFTLADHAASVESVAALRQMGRNNEKVKPG